MARVVTWPGVAVQASEAFRRGREEEGGAVARVRGGRSRWQ